MVSMVLVFESSAERIHINPSNPLAALQLHRQMKHLSPDLRESLINSTRGLHRLLDEACCTDQ